MDNQGARFIIFNTSELNQIDFSQVLETSIDILIKSVDQTKTFVKWDGETIPDCVINLSTKESPYTYDEILTILSTEEWTNPNPIM